jgi:hypothetical protein
MVVVLVLLLGASCGSRPPDFRQVRTALDDVRLPDGYRVDMHGDGEVVAPPDAPERVISLPQLPGM